MRRRPPVPPGSAWAGLGEGRTATAKPTTSNPWSGRCQGRLAVITYGDHRTGRLSVPGIVTRARGSFPYGL